MAELSDRQRKGGEGRFPDSWTHTRTRPSWLSVDLDDVCVKFTSEEWALLCHSQKTLYKTVTQDTVRSLAFVGKTLNVKSIEDEDKIQERNSSPMVESHYERKEVNFCGNNIIQVSNRSPSKDVCMRVTSRRSSVFGKALMHPTFSSSHRSFHATHEPQKSREYIEKSYKSNNVSKMFSIYPCHEKDERTPIEQIHERAHAEQNSYECKNCGKDLGSSRNLRIHERTHSGQKPYEYKQCGKAFTYFNALQKHQKTHDGPKTYECKQCGRAFISSKILLSHERTHTGQKPYKCVQCGKAFTTSSYFQLHKRMHSGQKPYECKQCGNVLTSSSSLRVHGRIHSGEKPYECRECDERFTYSCQLQKHTTTHTGQKRYECKQCGKGFSTSSYIRVHERTHSGEKPYECKQCVKSFTYSCQLRKHRKTYCTESL